MQRLTALAIVLSLAGVALAQDPAKAAQEAAKKAAEEAAKKAKAAEKPAADVSAIDMPMPKPGPEHERLKSWAGEYTFVNKFSMGPGQTTETRGTSSSKIEFNGFHLITEDRGEFNGMPFVGRMTLGFDPSKKKYVGSWVDNFGPEMVWCEGDFDDQTKTLTLFGDMHSMITQAKVRTRMVTRYKDADTHVFNMYQPGPDGAEMMLMEITYTRKK